MKGLTYSNIVLLLIDGDTRYEVLESSTRSVLIYHKNIHVCTINKEFINPINSNYIIKNSTYNRARLLLG